MREFSNKMIITLLIVTIIVSLGGTLISISRLSQLELITGKVTVGNVSVNITEQATLNLTTPNIDFGNGYVTGGSNCTINSQDGTGSSTCWSNTGVGANSGIVVENIGNVGINVSVTFAKNGTDFIGGTNPELKYKCRTDGSSSGTSRASSFTLVDNTSLTYECWANLAPMSSSDSFYFDISLNIPDNAQGLKNNTITFTAAKNMTG
ncbi:hypothetical protein D6745_01395 [Candidatus Woesearchaeota archaeon]|nr:MAG: hypothetical protein D6745_01395 [Candidatus Woesearchaeota archaeon]